MYRQMNRDKWVTVVRILMGIMGAIIEVMGINWSAQGFAVSGESKAFGYILGVLVFVLEMGVMVAYDNVTLRACGFLAYLYDAVTNFIGVTSMQTVDYVKLWYLLPLPILIALLTVLVPEPMIQFSLIGEASSDMIGRILHIEAKPAARSLQKPIMPLQPKPPQNQPRPGTNLYNPANPVYKPINLSGGNHGREQEAEAGPGHPS